MTTTLLGFDFGMLGNINIYSWNMECGLALGCSIGFGLYGDGRRRGDPATTADDDDDDDVLFFLESISIADFFPPN